MILAAAAVFLASTPATSEEAARATIEMRAAERAYDRCMNSQRGLADDNGTGLGPGPAAETGLGICRPALESMLMAQQHWVGIANISEEQRRQARRAIRSSIQGLRDASLFPSRAPRFYGQ